MDGRDTGRGTAEVIGAAEFQYVDEAAEAAPGHARVAMETPSAALGIREMLQANRRTLEGAGRALAFAGILLAAASPGFGVFLFIVGVIMALLGA